MRIIFEPNYLARFGHARAIRIFDRDPTDHVAAELTWPNGTPFIQGNYGTDGREVKKEATVFLIDLARLLGIRVRIQVIGGGGGFSIPGWDL